MDDATWQRIRDYVDGHRRLPRQASQQYLLTGLLRCPVCGCRMGGKARKDRSRSYRCCGVNLGANAPVPGCAITALADQVEQAVLAEVLPLIEGAVSSLPELRQALERAWAALRTPATLQDELQERQRQQLLREAEQARSRLTKAAVLFADGDIDKPGYELLRDKARVDLDAATEALSQLQVVEPSVALPPLETCWQLPKGGERRCGMETSRRSARCWRRSSSESYQCELGVGSTKWRSPGRRLPRRFERPSYRRTPSPRPQPPNRTLHYLKCTRFMGGRHWHFVTPLLVRDGSSEAVAVDAAGDRYIPCIPLEPTSRSRRKQQPLWQRGLPIFLFQIVGPLDQCPCQPPSLIRRQGTHMS